MGYCCPDVTVIIPVYNVERYLPRCLDSALAQTLTNIEIICINDGSTDSSPQIIEGYMARDSRVKVINKENSGYGASMNMGLTEATGEYVGILESDDFFEPDALERLFNAAKRADADVAKADFYLYWSTPQEKDELFGWVDEDFPSVVSPFDCPEVFYRKPSIWSAIYKREFLARSGIRFLETPGASYQDASFNFKVWACADEVAIVNAPILHYRQDNESSSVNSPGKAFCVCDEYREMVRFVDGLSEGAKKDRLRKMLVRLRFDTYMWNYDRLTEPLQLEFLKTMREDFQSEDRRGLLDESLFDEGKLRSRRLVVSQPDVFHLERSKYASRGKWDTVKRYYRAGGFPLVVKMLISVLRR